MAFIPGGLDDGACDNGSFCNGLESCDASAECVAGAPPDLDDGVTCTAHACDETSDHGLHTFDATLCGLGIQLWFETADGLCWIDETGYAKWNVYRRSVATWPADLDYQPDGAAVSLAGRACGRSETSHVDPTRPPSGQALFLLVTGQSDDFESGLCMTSSGESRSGTAASPA